MKLALFSVTFYASGAPKFVAGKHYPLTEETAAQIAQGNAALVEASVDVERAQNLAAKAQAAADKATASALQAQADLIAAQEAARLADEAQADEAASASREQDARAGQSAQAGYPDLGKPGPYDPPSDADAPPPPAAQKAAPTKKGSAQKAAQ